MKINCETISFEQQLGAEEDHIVIWDLNLEKHSHMIYHMVIFSCNIDSMIFFIYVFSVIHIHISNSVLQTVMIESQSLHLAALYLVFLCRLLLNQTKLCVTSIVCFFGSCILGSVFQDAICFTCDRFLQCLRDL